MIKNIFWPGLSFVVWQSVKNLENIWPINEEITPLKVGNSQNFDVFSKKSIVFCLFWRRNALNNTNVFSTWTKHQIQRENSFLSKKTFLSENYRRLKSCCWKSGKSASIRTFLTSNIPTSQHRFSCFFRTKTVSILTICIFTQLLCEEKCSLQRYTRFTSNHCVTKTNISRVRTFLLKNILQKYCF